MKGREGEYYYSKQNGNVVEILKLPVFVDFLFLFFFQLLDKEQPSYMNQSLEELGIGSYKQIATVRKERERESVCVYI